MTSAVKFQAQDIDLLVKGAKGVGGYFSKVKAKPLAQTAHISSRYSYLAEVYGTNYFAVQGVYTYIEPKTVFAYIALLFFFPPLIISYALKDNGEMYYYNIIYDVTLAKMVFREIRHTSSTASRTNMAPILYDSYNASKK